METPVTNRTPLNHPVYKIVIHTRVADGYVETGSFVIGNDRQQAMELYGQLQGTEPVALKDMLRMHIVETENEADDILSTLGCSLDDITHNVKTIIKETFRILNLI